MSKFSRDKGLRGERHLVHFLQEAGLAGERVPLSGASGGRYSGDVSVPVLGDDLTLEVKVRASGFASLYSWLGANDALIVKADRQPMLVVMSLRKAVDFVKRAEGYRVRAESK